MYIVYITTNSKLEEVKNNLRITWTLLNEVINKRENNPSLPSSFKSDGNTITDPMDITDRFCKYFAALPWIRSYSTFLFTFNLFSSSQWKSTQVSDIYRLYKRIKCLNRQNVQQSKCGHLL